MATPPVQHFRAGSDPAAVDVLVLAALQDELGAVLALADGGAETWEVSHDQEGFRCYRRTFANERGGELRIAAAWIGEMGPEAAARRAQQLARELAPGCLAMCGICAGDRKKVALGDVIVADQLYRCDVGKLVAGQGMFHSLRTFDLASTWKMDASFLARELDTAPLAAARPVSRGAQRRWLLAALLAEEGRGPAPASHPERRRRCPEWTEVVREAERLGHVEVRGGKLSLSAEGREIARNDQVFHVDGLPEEPRFQVHVGAIATGAAVQEDATLFDRLRRLVRTTLGAEMEGAAVGEVAASFKRPALVVKAVSDHADEEKDDAFREFACRASAEVLLAFLLKHFEPLVRKDEPEREPDNPRLAQHDRRGLDHDSGFLGRVEQVAKHHHPGAKIVRLGAPAPFAGVLEISAPVGALVHVRVTGAVEQAINEALVAQYLAEVERPFRQQNPSLSSTLVHGGPAAPVDLAKSALRQGVILQSFGEYQGLLDFTRYLAQQTKALEEDEIYPPSLYVEQPARWSLAGGREEKATESALATLWDLLDAEHARLALVLGDFGAGKTFLLHELARKMARDKHPVVPVLVEMSRLEKQRDLRVLLAQHFALADMGRFDPAAFQYMLAEGKVALLFDGFDELALRLTYDRAVEHFQTVMAAAQGKQAKVVVTSRTQHFLTDQQVRRALAQMAESVPGYRLIQLDKFGEPQIRRFLGNMIPDAREAEERYELLDEVKDLLGLSENPRMLGFVAKIEPAKLREAKEQSGEITAAKLYEILIGQWLEFEWARANPPGAPKGIERERLRELVGKIAGVLWEKNAKALAIADFAGVLVAEGLDAAVVQHMVGSGSLLVRDSEGRFSFVHRSVMEWLVAEAAAREVREAGDSVALAQDEMSELMADFLISLATAQKAEAWAWEKGGRSGEGHAKKNAARVLKRIEKLGGSREIEIPVTMDLEGQDFRGQDLSRVDWRGANLAGADLRNATLIEAKMAGASLVGAKLGRADMVRADLRGADLGGADLGFAKLMGADLRRARRLLAGQLRGARLVGAQGVEVAAEDLLAMGAAPPAPPGVLPMLTVPSGCNAVAWAADWIASGHDDGDIRLWDTASGKAIRTLHGHTGSVESVVFSPDGRSLVSGSYDTTVRIWDVATGTARRTLEGHSQRVLSVAFSHDGLALASGSLDNTVRVWDVATGAARRTLKGHANGIAAVAFSPDGGTIASGSYDGTVRLWDIAAETARATLQGHGKGVLSVAFSPDGQTLASGSHDTMVHLWNVATGATERVLSGHITAVTSLAFSPDGQTLASGAAFRKVAGFRNTTLCLWDVATRTLRRSLEGHLDSVRSVAFSPDGATLASGSYDNTVCLWDAATGAVRRILRGHANWVRSVTFSRNGRSLAFGSEDGIVRVWNVRSGAMVQSSKGNTGRGLSVDLSSDGKTLACGSMDGTVRLYDIRTGATRRLLRGHTGSVLSVAFHPFGMILASGSADKTVRLWNGTTGATLWTLRGHVNGISSVAFSPDGMLLAAASSDAWVHVWTTADGALLHTLVGQESFYGVAFSSDGLLLASGSADATVHIWDVAANASPGVLVGHSSRVSSVAFSPVGKRLASGSDDTTVRLWDVATATCLRTFQGHTNTVLSVAFSPDGLTLASASADGTVRLWDAATTRCLAILLATAEGWAAFTPDGRYKLGGDIAGSFWHVIGLCRFEPGELDDYIPGLRVPDDASLLPPGR